MKPVRLFRHASQVIYSRKKGGVDGLTEYLAAIDLGLPLSFEVKYICRSLRMVSVNAFIAWRLNELRNLLSATTYPDLDTLRRQLNRQSSLADWVEDCAKEMLRICDREEAELSSQNVLMMI